jgi:ribosome-binding protein aMBF1 (putative translation factor)
MARRKDFLDELIEESTKRDPRFPKLLEEAKARRALAKQMVAARVDRGLSQTVVAAAMRTAQSVVSKLEAGSDVKLSTMQRYCEVIGQNLVISIGPRKPTKRATSTATRRAGKARAKR